MIQNILLLAAGLAMILVGANYLTEGASAIARRFGLSDLVVGLTVVAFGTSAPELSISVISALQGSGGLAIGNVVGSNIFNTLLIIGVVALCRPIRIAPSIMTGEMPLGVLASVALVVMALSPVLDGEPAELTHVDGLLLLLFFCVFMRYVYRQAKAQEALDGASEPAAKQRPLWLASVMTLGGLAALIWGGDIFVDNASAIARAMGVSDAVIGLTIVAVGTSLPELATSVTAALKGNTGIALGNVIGSNIFNILMVLGCAAAVHPLPFGGVTGVDLGVMLGSVFLFWFFGWKIGVRTITRGEGAFMALCYVGYTVWLVVNA